MFDHTMLPPIDSLAILAERPGQVYIAEGGKELYVSDSNGRAHLYVGPYWGQMSNDEISSWLAEHPLQQ